MHNINIRNYIQRVRHTCSVIRSHYINIDVFIPVDLQTHIICIAMCKVGQVNVRN